MSADSGPSWTSPPMAAAAAATPAKPSAEAPAAGQRIEYLTALRFPTENRDWLKNVLLLGLCLLIPVLGSVVLLGYAYEITELRHRGSGKTYPSFDFNRFAIYVTRGVWAFLISFVVQSIIFIAYEVLSQGTLWGTLLTVQANEEAGTIFAAIVIPTVIIMFLSLIIGLATVSRPLMLRAGLTQDFALTLKFPWLGDFLKRMWLETLLVTLFTMLLTLMMTPFGLAACCIGMVFVNAFMAIVGSHFDWQLYELYLARGGEPIPLKPLPGDVPPVVTGP